MSSSNITSLHHYTTAENARNFGRKPEGKKPFLRRERKWEYDIKMDIKYWNVGTGFNWRSGYSGDILY